MHAAVSCRRATIVRDVADGFLQLVQRLRGNTGDVILAGLAARGEVDVRVSA
jgi:hypothetical protein